MYMYNLVHSQEQSRKYSNNAVKCVITTKLILNLTATIANYYTCLQQLSLSIKQIHYWIDIKYTNQMI